MVGYIGPNGAGKSTTIKMLIGILVPSGGTVRVDGLDPSRDRIARRPPHRRRVRPAHPAVVGPAARATRSTCSATCTACPPADHARQRSARWSSCSTWARSSTTPVRQLSLGQRMRGELAAALLHDPPILFLDEPTIGLDVVVEGGGPRRSSATCNREQGTTVLLTTHDLVDVERLCERLLIIDHGRVIEDGTVGGHQGPLRHRAHARRRPRRAGPAARRSPGATVDRVEGPRQWLRFRRDDALRRDRARRGHRPGRGPRHHRRGAGHRRRRPPASTPARPPSPRTPGFCVEIGCHGDRFLRRNGRVGGSDAVGDAEEALAGDRLHAAGQREAGDDPGDQRRP